MVRWRVFGIGFFAIVGGSVLEAATASEYATPEECILDKMQGVTSDVAAKAIIAACRRLTAPPPPPAKKLDCRTPLSGAETPQIGKKAEVSLGFFSVEVYNPSPTYTITEMVLQIDTTTSAGKASRQFKSSMFLHPLSNEEFSMDIGVDNGELKALNWRLVSSTGCDFKR